MKTTPRLTDVQLKLACLAEQVRIEYSEVHFPLEQQVFGKDWHSSPPDCAQAKEQSGL